MQPRCKHAFATIQEGVFSVGPPRGYITLTRLELELKLEYKRIKPGGGQEYDRSSD
jgi:hypothetical protein